MSSMSADKPAIVPVEEILSEWHREILSMHAQKLYQTVWLRMRHKRDLVVRLNDADASRRARVLIRYIPSARAELIAAGLLDCWQGPSQWRYSYREFNDENAPEN
jgi:hypothetical protein